ncbi:MAG TPA: hypothetical protein VGX25_12150 [Actinophytocola sp.]|uniref:hypothetical protein n=1 Tax=Actinophytocola sp. TaxID=1872138 RepID=UPI002DDD5F8A|nr:hypothetical protein [Actinophytocola sp.]HEV2780135.1 hypothetical protein [Actinophytocola sp.]
MVRRGRREGRHRLGTPGLVHCIEHRPVAEALAEYRRGWWTAITVPARHTLAGLRRRAATAAAERAWAPRERLAEALA